MTITDLKGVGAKRAHALQSAGIHTVEDLLNYFPRDYDDRSKIKTVAELLPEATNTIRGTIAYEPESVNLKRYNITRLKIKDHTGQLEIIWFNQPYLKKNFKKGSEYIFTGKVRQNGAVLQMQAPDYEPVSETLLTGGRIVPMYTTPKQYSQKTFRALIHKALSGSNQIAQDTLPGEILQRYDLADRDFAVRNIHFPESDESFLKARRRLVFEELFYMQVALSEIKNSVAEQEGILFTETDYAQFLDKLPFALTNAQAQTIADIIRDCTSSRRMNRLIQGDVGSGKTAVAFAAAYLAAKNGCQTALMAPTDVLAGQHFAQCAPLFDHFGYETVLLTGSIGTKARRQALAKISDGTAAIIIGTHALIQKGVTYHNLGLCITDEQHRFGVNQRTRLSQKGAMPHTLVMSATPIPRTLGLILYGDLDISVIGELPPGRQEIKTYSVTSQYRERVNGFILKEAEQNRQAYVICPSIADGESELNNVETYTTNLAAALPRVKIAKLHGKMKPAEKQEIMDAFKANQIQVIVSTTVIEVGVNVPNATLMVVENAERFGLSQLHQLRGRVGRGTAQSYCILITNAKNNQTTARMKAMTQTTDGFRLAELDLEQRGAGDFFGTRQHGLPTFKIANLYRDLDILEQAQEAARSAHSSSIKNIVNLELNL